MLFLDVETQRSAENEHGIFRTDVLKISYIGVIDYPSMKEYDFWEKDVKDLLPMMQSADVIVGYNIFHFDMPVIANYLGYEIKNLPQLDIMEAVKETIGFRPKLSAISNATLGRGKLGSGLDAIEWYEQGELEKLKKYCLEDVRLTVELYDYGIKNKTIKYYDRNGFVKEAPINWELGYKNYTKSVLNAKTDTAQDDVLKMF